jgi:uncharacterized protein YggE
VHRTDAVRHASVERSLWREEDSVEFDTIYEADRVRLNECKGSSEMSKTIKLFMLVALLGASVAACDVVQAAPRAETQVAAESGSEPRTITVIGEGKVRLKPDIATINVGAEVRAGQVSDAKAEVDAQMAAIYTALQEMGVAGNDIQASHYGIHYEREPVLREGPAPETREGYVVSNMVRVTIRDVEKAGDVLDAVVQAGANMVYGVDFTVSDESTWQSQARANAMAEARTRAHELADLAGVELGEVLTVSEVIDGMPVSLMGIRSEMGGGAMAPGELELSTQIQVMFAVQ